MMHAKKTKKRVAVFSLVIATLVVGIGFAVSYAGTALQVRADNVETYRDFDFDDHDPAFYVEAQPAFTDAVWVEAVPAEAEDEDDSDSSNAPSVTREAFVPPVITVLPSPSQRHEIPASALSMEDAAQIGALYIWDMFGVSIDGMYVQMHYSNHERGLRPVWSGRVVQTREGLILESDLFNPMFSFNIDADTGMRIDIIYHGLRARDVLSEDELETFRRVMPMPEEIEMRNAWFDTILDILTPEEIAFYTEEARAFAQRHFNNSTVVDVQLGYEQIRGPFPSPVFDEQGNIASLELGGFVFTVTDDTGRVAEVTIPSRSGLFRYSDIRTNQNDVNPDFVFEDDGYGVG